MGDADNLFLKIEKKSLASQTKQAIRNLIQKKRPDYLPSERKMEELLQVSRTTIRNALKELEMEKRLLPLHGKGYRVLYPDTRGTVTGRIGIAVPLHSDDFLQSVFFHLLKAVLGFGFQPAVVPFEGRNREKTNDKLSLLASECDGLILFSTLLDIGDVNLVLHDYLNRCVMIPYTYGDFSGGRVYADLSKGYEKAVDYLFCCGHRRIALLAASRDRVEACKRGLGSFFDPDLLVSLRSGSRSQGYRGMEELLSRKKQFTAVTCQNDATALGAMEACLAHGLKIPEDMSFIGADNIPDSAEYPVALTTLELNLKEICENAMNLLLQGIRSGEIQPEIRVGTKLIIRRSVRRLKERIS